MRNIALLFVGLLAFLVAGCGGDRLDSQEPLTFVRLGTGLATSSYKIVVLEAKGSDEKVYLFPVLNPSEKLMNALRSLKAGNTFWITYAIRPPKIPAAYFCIEVLITPTIRYYE